MGFYANKIFPWVLDATEPKEMAEQRRIILSKVRGEVLEIGIGTGVNLPFYPDNIKTVVGLEPSDAMQPRALQRRMKQDEPLNGIVDMVKKCLSLMNGLIQ